MYFKISLCFADNFSFHDFEADNCFQPTTACEQCFLQKGNPSSKKMVHPLCKILTLIKLWPRHSCRQDGDVTTSLDVQF